MYIFYCVAPDGKETPFYVGQADCFQTRMTDYQRKQFSCSTDFNVGEAAAYLKSKNYGVKVMYWASENRKQEEDDNIQALRLKKHKLLNDEELWYEYRVSKQERNVKISQQRNKVHGFCAVLIANNPTDWNASDWFSSNVKKSPSSSALL